MKNYKKIAPIFALLGSFGLQSLIGCASMQTRFDKEREVMRKLDVQRIEDIDHYFCGYKASWRSKGAIREALEDNALRYKTYPKNVCETMKQMDTNKDYLITDQEARSFK